jgi:hypothetical protein
MNNLRNNDQISELGDKARNLVRQGNARHIVIRKANGEKMAEFSMTVAVVGALFIAFMTPFTWILVFAAAIYGMSQKLRVEVVREISDGDDSIHMD